MRLLEHRDQEVFFVARLNREIKGSRHYFDHFPCYEVNSHMGREDSPIGIVASHFFEQREVPHEVVEGDQRKATMLEHAMDLLQVGINLQRGEMDEDIVGVHEVHGRITEFLQGESVEAVVRDIPLRKPVSAGSKHSLRHIGCVYVGEQFCSVGGYSSSPAPDLERSPVGVLPQQTQEYLFSLPFITDKPRIGRRPPLLDIAIPITPVVYWTAASQIRKKEHAKVLHERPAD